MTFLSRRRQVSTTRSPSSTSSPAENELIVTHPAFTSMPLRTHKFIPTIAVTGVMDRQLPSPPLVPLSAFTTAVSHIITEVIPARASAVWHIPTLCAWVRIVVGQLGQSIAPTFLLTPSSVVSLVPVLGVLGWEKRCSGPHSIAMDALPPLCCVSCDAQSLFNGQELLWIPSPSSTSCLLLVMRDRYGCLPPLRRVSYL